MYRILLIAYLTIASRIHGGGIVQNVPRQARNLLYAAPYPAVVALYSGFDISNWHDWIWPTAAFVSAFTGIDTGHYSFWYMGAKMPDQRSGAVGDLLREFKFLEYGSTPYCIVGMALKGAFIAAGTFSWPVIAGHALAWPAAYWIGMRVFSLRNDYAEMLAGLFGGAALLLYGMI